MAQIAVADVGVVPAASPKAVDVGVQEASSEASDVRASRVSAWPVRPHEAGGGAVRGAAVLAPVAYESGGRGAISAPATRDVRREMRVRLTVRR
ncbi:hypothetical protein [Streptomyces sp. NPDC060035]|uniref:hypothetical protein n=1 Tax=Streptomyces sp. NPDC060035 TaxID=3347044 RepID=UPI003674D11A